MSLWLLVYAITFHPADVQAAELQCPAETPELSLNQTVRVLNWNVQYMGSKNNVFWYDLPINMSAEEKAKYTTVDYPSQSDITSTLDEVARVIKDENPDLVMLQEVDQNSGRTHNVDQVAELQQRLGGAYPCQSEAYYWKASFVPHPNIATSVGMKLLTLSKYKIESATRHQLPLIPQSWLQQQFNLKRAVLESRLPVKNGTPFVALNTHLSAFSQGSDTMEKQIAKLNSLLQGLDKEKLNWILGGDFNLLPPGISNKMVHPTAEAYYNEVSEIEPLFASYASVFTTKELQGPDRARYFSYLSNSPLVEEMDRTIDYIFHARSVVVKGGRVRQKDTQKISDHMPLIADFSLTKP
ncbi:MAG: endonuclease/exonuclease/phosphatase family protein [Leptospiraceae bacterium]|nr:endonuclease/exonuclease/phosphatase family protein [Leptospiraceae bacterium]